MMMRGVLTLLVFTATTPAIGADEFIAGLEPAVRPEGAPVIDRVSRSEAQRANALRGIEAPVPVDVQQMVDSQGNWYTPFEHPGMIGPYDIRRLHRSK